MLVKLKPTFRISILYITISLLVGCASNAPHQKNVVGHFQSKNFNKIQIAYWQFIKNKVTIKGNELTTNIDSTFNYTTCGNIINGKFKVFGDSLFLFFYSNTKKLDSSLFTVTKPYDTLVYYLKNDNALVNERVLLEGQLKGYTQYDYLVRVK
ncbi:MAG: hypothetical protein V4620_13490 [Bacteroidota bacterium]